LRLYHEPLNLKGKALLLQSHIPSIRLQCGDESQVVGLGDSRNPTLYIKCISKAQDYVTQKSL